MGIWVDCLSDDFNLDDRLKVVDIARKNGMFAFRDEDVVKEAIEWFLTSQEERGEQPKRGKVKRLIRILTRKLN